MKKIFLLSLTLFILSCSSEDKSDEIITPTPQETFGNWSPSFSNQTSNFTQTRTGSQGTQQTRTIEVSTTISSSSSSEEELDDDVNNDGDLFEEIEVIVTTYSASENLGSHQITNYEIIEDNDMVLVVGNQSWDLSNGHIKDYGSDFDCSGVERYHNLDIHLYSDGISPDSYGDTTGDGVKIEVWLFPSEDRIVSGEYKNYLEFWNSNSILSTSFESYYDIESYLDDIGEEEEEELYSIFCDISATNFFSYAEWGEFENDYNITSDGDDLDLTNATLLVEIDEDNVYTIKFQGCLTRTNLPISFFYKGYLGYYDTTYTSKANQNNPSNVKPKSKSLF